MLKRQVLLIAMLVGSMLLLQGCVVAAIGLGAGTIAYVRGDLQAVESESIDDVYEATLKALEELELRVTRKSKDALGAEIITYDAQDKKITIRLKSVAEKTTELSIRIGVFGKETKSRLIYQKIQKYLRD
jgi:endo-beta-N-acetylglucosaminidase D